MAQDIRYEFARHRCAGRKAHPLEQWHRNHCAQHRDVPTSVHRCQRLPVQPATPQDTARWSVQHRRGNTFHLARHVPGTTQLGQQ
jgi:hypothetical protein